MENNNSISLETLTHSTFSFPRHRRRPLKSHTYDTFTRILSLCRHPAFSSHLQDDKFENALVDPVSIDNGSEQYRGFSDIQAKVKGFDCTDVPREANEEFAQENANLSDLDCVVGENKGNNQVVEIVNDRNVEQFISDSRDSEYCSHVKELKGDEEIRLREVYESIEKSLNMDMDMDMVSELEIEEKGDEEELQRTQMELEEMISSSFDLDASRFVDVGQDVEEGEISGEDGYYDRSMDMLFEDDVVEEKGKERQVCEDVTDNEKFARELSPQVVAKPQSYATGGQDASVSENKRKRGPLSKEKKAKKKKRERIKRAEKNRKLGVKRLKLQPVSKPKTITYCRHYLNGRCQEGEKCKFSHDTIPLTKSKPCCHFARHSCMKGDDCPFDHELSKYPCNNYVTSGFCSRGAGCLFSHKMTANEGSLTTSTALESIPKSQSILPESKKQENIHRTLHQKAEANTCSTGIAIGKSTELNMAVPLHKGSAQPPKGVNMFFPGKSSPTENGKTKLAGHEKVQSGEDNSEKVNEVTERSATRTPKGINFLSFGEATIKDSSGKAVSSMFLDSGIGKSTLGDPSRSMEIASSASSPKRDDSAKVANPFLPSAAPQGTNSFSSGKVLSDHSSAAQHSNSHPNEDKSGLTFSNPRSGAPLMFQNRSGMPYRPVSSSLLDKSAAENSIGIGSSSKTPFLSNTQSSVQKALQSTLSFAAKFETKVKFDPLISSRSSCTNLSEKAKSSENKSVKGLTVLDFLYGDTGKTKT